jgi:uncharacterized protein GlcG (DUF336 family)
MGELTLDKARQVIDETLAAAKSRALRPLSVAVVDARGALVALASQENATLMRWRIALGKAQACLCMNANTRALQQMALARPHFISAVAEMAPLGFVPVPGGVLARDASGEIVGAVGVSGDTSDADEAVAMAGLEAAGLVPHQP